jgi:hypothetical protein
MSYRMELPAFVGGKWIIWKVTIPDVNMRSLRIGSVIYARCIFDGMSEMKSNQYAEKAVFENYYRVKY